jgi:hypothetical protein
MKPFMIATALAMLATPAYALDNSPQQCSQFKGKQEIQDESAIDSCLRIGAKAYVKKSQKIEKLKKQGKLCGEYWGDEFCKRR